ncbi:MAG: CRISPR-associated endonuclease Cas1 [Rhodocyclaceae bacterium]|nr:CRISPR-associated endonuclease Cas1 [Rhodocyclaceae bacterium]
MATLLLDRADLEIKSESDALALYENGVRRGTVPLKLIERVVIQGSKTRLDSGVLIKLAEAGAATLLLSPRAARKVAIVLGPLHNDASVRLAQSRRVMDEAFCLTWARDVVRAKLERQRRLLRTGLQERPDARKPLFDALSSLDNCAGQIATANSPASLRGLEGSAARAHFQGLSALLPPILGFNGRNRRPPRDPVNACLSLAYTLLHFEAVMRRREINPRPVLR